MYIYVHVHTYAFTELCICDGHSAICTLIITSMDNRENRRLDVDGSLPSTCLSSDCQCLQKLYVYTYTYIQVP